MKVNLIVALTLVTIAPPAMASEPDSLSRLAVSENRRFLVTESGEPFFWLADTSWALLNRLDEEEAKRYLQTRAQQGFNVVQVFLTAPWMRTNTAGEEPFLDGDPLRFNPVFFRHVDLVLDMAEANQIYVLLCIGQVLRNEVPAWQIRTAAGAYRFGGLITRRLGSHSNVLWNVGQDFAPVGHKSMAGDVEELIRAMAEGIADAFHDEDHFDGKANYRDTLISYHPNGKHSSGEWFHNEPWLAFNMVQTGHDYSFPNHRMIREDFMRTPTKPILDAEPAYEGHPASFNTANGRIQAYHVRRHAYWAVFSGACGHTYGSNDIWPFREEEKRPFAYGEMAWQASLQAPGARQMRHLRSLIESYPFLTQTPDLRLVRFPQASDRNLCPALRGKGYAMVYIPSGQAVTVRLHHLEGGDVQARWFNPRDGEMSSIGTFPRRSEQTFDPPGFPREGNDWVLLLESER